jgi:hypothetical protein
MNYKVEATPNFLAEAKKLSKKYPSLKNDIISLTTQLATHPTMGTSLGMNTYKIRMSITSKGKGKSGGARVITCVKFIVTSVYLVSIFDKSEKENITDKELRELIKKTIT